MRILVVSNLYPPAIRGGYEIECAGVVAYLRERGDDVHVVTSSRRRGAESSEPSVARVLPLLEHSRRSRLIAPVAAAIGARATCDQIERFRPDFAFVWNGAQIPHAAIHVVLKSGIPTAFRVCERWFGGLFSRDRFMGHLSRQQREDPLGVLARAANKLPSLRLDMTGEVPVAISWVSEYVRRSVAVPLGLAPVFERTIYPATDRDAEFASVDRRESSTPTVVFLGRLTPEKGSDVLIEAVGLLARQGIRPQLVIAGSGSRSDASRLRRAADRAEIADSCRFVGHLATPQIRDLFAAATVLVVPSTWAEPFGLAIIEGALARVPLVATRVGGIPEILSDVDEILLVPPSDPRELARAIAQTIAHPTETQERVRRAFSRVQSMSWGAYAAATGAFVDESFEVLSSRAASKSLPLL
jgi:glycosyltransferase involved in cell wall biosynthesis